MQWPQLTRKPDEFDYVAMIMVVLVFMVASVAAAVAMIMMAYGLSGL